ncbi:RNA 2'-phosphotransferase [Rufibacter tibetensis]|uniref:Probable RNA 2'-phosphotransferase n=1 Tax=Rufibacter tibetensis TaxID=512763 RepID=A0A0P0C8T0_9BACT|nr:RNA 2'-phosphotransferase [Rufibacter tibetensis]ALI97751.1 RNA 2'-phosphotransferase [Rufibacter tibetensis]
MNNRDLSKFLSLVLRHKPEALGIQLDKEGWTSVEQLLQKLNAKGKPITRERLEEVVSTNDKQRFAFNQDHTRIRANQGHSLAVDLQLKVVNPPEFLYHGTAERNVASILQNGLHKRSRQYVHLSSEVDTARKVGARHGKPFIFLVKSGLMRQEGINFYRSENKVWLTDYVAPEYLEMYKEP